MRFEFSITNTEEEHFHEEIELIYVFEGTMDIWVENEKHSLSQDDFLIININELHKYKTSNKVLIGKFYVSYGFLRQLMPQKNMIFWCNAVIDKSSAYDEVRQSIKELVKDFFEKSGIGKIHLFGQYYEILYLITKHFLVIDKDTNNNLDHKNNEGRIAHITDYVVMNYQNKISLSELASQLYLSEAYLSKYIKKQFGMNFLEYINNIRLNHAMGNLVYSDHSITRIALENGFANVGTFNRVFKNRYKTTPKTYRTSQRQNSILEKAAKENEDLIERVEAYIAANPYDVNVKETEWTLIEVNCCEETLSFNKAWGKMINVGTASDLLKSNLQQHISEITRRLRFSHIRIWDLYSTEMYIDINAKNHYYNFDKLNRVLDFVVGEGLFPYLELNIKPKKLLRSVREALINESSLTRFDDINNVMYFVEGLILHLIDRYSVEQIEKWYFELWKEESNIDVDSDGSMENYLKLFDAVAGTIHKYLPEAKIGGAGLSIRFGKVAIKNILEQWKSRDNQPDFISLYSFPYVRGEVDEIKINKTSTDRNYLLNYIDTANEIMNEVGYRETPLHISEWNSTVSNRNTLNDSCYKGAFIMKNLISTIHRVDLIGYWFASDLFADYYDTNELLSGSSGLLSKDGIPKPAYYAIEFLNRMGLKIIDKGENYLITDTGYREIRIACHNYKFFNHRYFMMHEDELDLLQQDLIFEDLESKTLKFVLKVEHPGHYEIKVHAINKNYGSVQDEWIRMACPGNLIQEDINYLKQVCVPRVSINHIESKEGELIFSTQMAANEIQFIQVKHKNK